MYRILLLFVIVTLYETPLFAQEKQIQIIEDIVVNRLTLYALNETETDYDVRITVEGTGFRQGKGKPRLTRVPATSKVRLKSLTLIKGQELNYTYQLEVNDSLSRRALRRQFELVKINPKSPIVVYIPENCEDCDSLMRPLQDGIYVFKSFNLSDEASMKEQLKMVLPQLDTIKTPVYSLGGHLFPEILTYEQLLKKLKQD